MAPATPTGCQGVSSEHPQSPLAAGARATSMQQTNSHARSLRSRLKQWYRRMRDRRTRRVLQRRPDLGRCRVVLASTGTFPNPTHAYVYQEMLGLLELGLDVRIFYGERRPVRPQEHWRFHVYSSGGVVSPGRRRERRRVDPGDRGRQLDADVDLPQFGGWLSYAAIVAAR